MEQLTKNQAVATSQEAVQNQNEPQLRDENAHNDKSVHGVLNPTYQAGLRRDAVQPEIGRASCRERVENATGADMLITAVPGVTPIKSVVFTIRAAATAKMSILNQP